MKIKFVVALACSSAIVYSSCMKNAKRKNEITCVRDEDSGFIVAQDSSKGTSLSDSAHLEMKYIKKKLCIINTITNKSKHPIYVPCLLYNVTIFKFHDISSNEEIHRKWVQQLLQGGLLITSALDTCKIRLANPEDYDSLCIYIDKYVSNLSGKERERIQNIDFRRFIKNTFLFLKVNQSYRWITPLDGVAEVVGSFKIIFDYDPRFFTKTILKLPDFFPKKVNGFYLVDTIRSKPLVIRTGHRRKNIILQSDTSYNNYNWSDDKTSAYP